MAVLAPALPYISAAASIGGTFMQMQGIRAQGKGQSQAALFNAEIHERNKKVAEQQAEWRKFTGATEVLRFRDEFAGFQGTQRVALAGSGVSPDTGTGRLLQEEAAREAAQEIAMMEMQAETDAMGFREKAINQGLAADLERLYARNYRTAARYRAQAAMISGVSKSAYLLASV